MRCALNTCVAVAVGLAGRHVSRQLRLAYLAPEVLKRLVYGREGPAVTVLDLSDCAALPWAEQAREWRLRVTVSARCEGGRSAQGGH